MISYETDILFSFILACSAKIQVPCYTIAYVLGTLLDVFYLLINVGSSTYVIRL